MARYVDKVLGVNEETEGMVLVGSCDVIIEGLTSGSIKLQYKLPPTTELPSPVWKDFPNGSFSGDAFKTIFVSSDQIFFKLVGVSNNSGVYCKLSRFMTRS